jgi:hypothetical protein
MPWRAGHRTLLVVIAVGLLARDAAAQSGWDPAPVPISAPVELGVNGLGPTLGMDAAGNAHAIWSEWNAMAGSVKSARYDKASATWSNGATLADASGLPIYEPEIAVDAAGNAVAAWTALEAGERARAARYSAATGLWSDVPLTVVRSGRTMVAGNAAGDAIVVWNEFAGGGLPTPAALKAIRYSAASATWSAVEPLAATLTHAPAAGDVAIDGAGNAVVAWLGQATAQATRFSATNGSWGPVVDLSTPIANLAVMPPSLAMNEAGDAVASWGRITAVEAARWPAGAGAWEPAVTVSTNGSDLTRVAIGVAGDAVVVWTQYAGASASALFATRFVASTGQWAPPQPLSTGAWVVGRPAVAIDAGANAFVAWTQQVPPAAGTAIHAARQRAADGGWEMAPNLSPPTQSAYSPAIAVDGVSHAQLLWLQASGASASMVALGWRATPAAPALSGITPEPGRITAAFSLPAAADPSLAPTAVQYSLDGGTTWANAASGVSSPAVIDGLTDGAVYQLRLRALNVAGAGRSSTALPVRSGTDADPASFRVVTRDGHRVTFAWTAPAGIVPTGYLLEGWLPGQSQPLATLPTGGTATQLTLAVPDGEFFVRVAAVYADQRLGQSPALQIWVNRASFPASPIQLLGSAAGSTLALSWTNVWSAAPVGPLRLFVSGTVTGAIDLPLAESFTYSGVPPGTYTFTVATLSSGAPGGTSSPLTLTFPGTCAGPPGPPTAFSVSSQGGRVFVDWLPPAGGAAATSYVLAVTGAVTGAFPMSSRSLAVPVGPGSYTVRVAAVGPCGTSAFTAAVTVVVP